MQTKRRNVQPRETSLDTSPLFEDSAFYALPVHGLRQRSWILLA